MENLLKKVHSNIIAQFHAIQGWETTHLDPPSELQQVLDTYILVFELPTVLPSSWGEHGSQPPNLLPYRYPFSQKNEIEKIIQELLAVGVIRPSTRPYSSLVVMVLKKEGDWRMCHDFQALNKLIIKDKLSIPVIDDLLDELHGAQYFTKLDLRFRYHQIQMKEEDVPKMTFRTHEGHYKFPVMPFGLCNAPSTFQTLMNKIWKHYLQVFVLVFYDDILIYSTTWESHLQLVAKVLQLLQNHRLFVKKSKCSFGVKEVEYLGHIMGCDSVWIDPKKIQAMKDWPRPQNLKILRGLLGLTG